MTRVLNKNKSNKIFFLAFRYLTYVLYHYAFHTQFSLQKLFHPDFLISSVYRMSQGSLSLDIVAKYRVSSDLCSSLYI